MTACRESRFAARAWAVALLLLAIGGLFGCTSGESGRGATGAGTLISVAQTRAEIEAAVNTIAPYTTQWPAADRAQWERLTFEVRALLDEIETMHAGTPAPPAIDHLLQRAEGLYQRGAALVRPRLHEFGELGRVRLARFKAAHDQLLGAYDGYQRDQTAQTAARVLDAVVRLAPLAVKLGALL